MVKCIAEGNDRVLIERQFATGASGRQRVLERSHSNVKGETLVVTLLDHKLQFSLGSGKREREGKQTGFVRKERERERGKLVGY